MPDHKEHPGLTPDRNVEAGVADTFPASDPASATATQGPRAVPANELMRHTPPVVNDAVTLTRGFPDAEQAKRALENLVRQAPLDRAATQISTDPKVELRLQVPRNDAERIEALLRVA